MKSNQAFLAALFGAALIFLTPQAQANDSTQARVLYQKGNKAFRDGDDVMAREYYRQSLELEDSFDTLCNWGRAEARSKLWEEAYEHLRLCVELYPDDPDLAESKTNFRDLRDEVRKELTFEQAKPIDERVEADVKRREEEAAAAAEPAEPEVASGLGEPEPIEPEPAAKKSSARLPVSLILGGVGVAGLGVGGVFHGLAGGTKKDAVELQDEIASSGQSCEGSSAPAKCADLLDETQKRDAQANVGTVGLIAGGAFLVGAVVTYLVWPDTNADEVGKTESRKMRPIVDYAGRDGGWHFGFAGQF